MSTEGYWSGILLEMEICYTPKCKVEKHWIDSENYMEDFAHKMSFTCLTMQLTCFILPTVFSKITIENESRMTVDLATILYPIKCLCLVWLRSYLKFMLVIEQMAQEENWQMQKLLCAGLPTTSKNFEKIYHPYCISLTLPSSWT